MNYPNYNDYELISMVKENDENSYDILYQKYLPIIKKIASNYYFKYSNYGYDYEDFLQESHLAFQRALRYFDESRNSLFYTFVTVCLNRRLLSFSQRIVLKSDQYALAILPHNTDYTVKNSFQNKMDNQLVFHHK